MQNTWISLDRSPASGALIIHLRKRRTTATLTAESESKIRDRESLLTTLFCLCAGSATGMGRVLSTRLAKRAFGKVATLFYGRSTSTPSAVITRLRRISSRRRRTGFVGEW